MKQQQAVIQKMALRYPLRRIGLEIVVIVLVIFLDLLTKQWAKEMGVGICNEGVAYGMSSDILLLLQVFILLTVGVVWVLSLLGVLRFHRYLSLGLACIVAGGAANYISRLTDGCVWDWIPVGWGVQGNISDLAVDIGVISCILIVVYEHIKERNTQNSNSGSAGRNGHVEA